LALPQPNPDAVFVPVGGLPPPPSAVDLGVGASAPGDADAAPNLPLNPLASERAGITDPTQVPPDAVLTPQLVPPPAAQQLPAPQAVPNSPPPAPTKPGSNGGAAPGGGAGLPPGSADLQKEIAKGTDEERAAATNLGDVQQQNADDLAQAYQDRETLRRQQVADLAAEQLYARERKQALDNEDSRNLQIARDKTIPDFWEGSEGKLTGAAITVGLSGAAAALTGSTHNTALEAIQHNVDTYYQRETDKIQNLYRYAEAKGHLNDQVRSALQGQVTDLMQQHALTLASAADRIEQVQAQSQGRVDAAQAQKMSAALRARAAAEMGQARDLDLKIYDAKTKRIGANAEAAKVGIERQKLAQDGSEKADEAAFRTYVQAPHGKEAQVITNRLGLLDSAESSIRAAKSVGEVNQALDNAISADAGQGTRGVSMGQLHTIIPNLVSASGEVSNKVSQGWDGTAGKEYRTAVLRMVQQIKSSREAEYNQNRKNLETNLALTPHGQKNKDFAKTSAAQLYPERASIPTAADQNTWRPIPRNMAGAPQLKGKTQVLVDGSGNVVDAR
jgi:hypothetical protein